MVLLSCASVMGVYAFVFGFFAVVFDVDGFGWCFKAAVVGVFDFDDFAG